jgi:hypothetical protein
MAGLFIKRSFKLVVSPVVSLMSLCGIAWLICMQTVGGLRRLGRVFSKLC